MVLIGTIAAVIAAICGVLQLFSFGCSLYEKKCDVRQKREISELVSELASINLTFELKHSPDTEYFTQIAVFPKSSAPTITLTDQNFNSRTYRGEVSDSFALVPEKTVSVSFQFCEPFPRVALIVFRNSKIWKSKLKICFLSRLIKANMQI